MRRAQGSMEYLIIIAAVIAIAAIVILFLSSALQTQADTSTISKCKSAASQCKVELSTTVDSKCTFCYEQCVNKEQYELFPGAYNYCLRGEPEKIFDGSIDTVPPMVTGVEAIRVDGSSATITWETNEPADSFVDYMKVGEGVFLSANDTFLRMDHSVKLSGLDSGSTYVYWVTSRDGTGLEDTSEPSEFTTTS